MKTLEVLRNFLGGGEKKDVDTLIREAEQSRALLQKQLERQESPRALPGYEGGTSEGRRYVNSLLDKIRGCDTKIALLREKKRHEEKKAGQR